MQSGKRTRHIQLVPVLIALSVIIGLSVITLRHIHAADLEDQQKALNMIADFADRICSRVSLEGHSNQLSAQVKLELNSILKQLAGLGITGSGEYQRMEYQGVLQHELAKAISQSNDCQFAVFRELNDKLITQAGLPNRPPKPPSGIEIDFTNLENYFFVGNVSWETPRELYFSLRAKRTVSGTIQAHVYYNDKSWFDRLSVNIPTRSRCVQGESSCRAWVQEETQSVLVSLPANASKVKFTFDNSGL